MRNSLIRQAFILDSSDLGRRVTTGAGYKFLGIGVRTLVTVGSTAILARALTPGDFGYIAMATVITEFAALFAGFGFTNVLIQRRVINRLQLDTVFWATLAVGVILCAAVYALSYASGWLFADPQVGLLLRVLSVIFVLNSLTSVPRVVLSRLMRFRAEFWMQICTTVAGPAAAVSFAHAGFGVWSLVAGALAGALAAVLVAFGRVPFMPRLRFYVPLLTKTWRTSGSYFGGNFLYYLNMNLDLLLIGRNMGTVPLGFYQNARSLTDEIRARIATPIQQVLFPAFSSIQHDRERFQQLVVRSGSLLAAVVIPIGFGVSANASELVLTLYGEKWRPMIPLMTMFGISAAVRASTAIASPLFTANDRVGLLLRYSLVGTTLMLGGVMLTISHGIESVAIAVGLTSLYSLVTFRAAMALIGLGLRQMMQILLAPTAAALAMWIGIAVLRRSSVDWGAHHSVLLLFHVAIGCILYLITLHLISRRYWLDIREVLAAMVRKNK